MIRHVSVFTLKEGADVSVLAKAVDEVCDRVAGPIAHSYGPDAGLRAGNAGFALTFDFENEDAYRAWDTNPEHERIRREVILPLVASVVRCQFRL